MANQSARVAHNLRLSGNVDGPPMLFAHGFGCDQTMWRLITPDFTDRYRVILFDYVGMGGAARTFDSHRYSGLEGYAGDVVAIIEELDLQNIVFVGHSVSCMIGVLAARQIPDRFAKMVMIGPSPHYLDDGEYLGGFSRADITDLLHDVEHNFVGWSAAITPLIMGHPDRPELAAELASAFCRMEPAVALDFARATFLSDNRADLAGLRVPTLILQGAKDMIAGVEVGKFTSQQIPLGEIHFLSAEGHCPHLSAPEETSAAIHRFLEPKYA